MDLCSSTTDGATTDSTTFSSVLVSKSTFSNCELSYESTKLELIEPNLKLKLWSPSVSHVESVANVSKINEPSNFGANCPDSITSFLGDVIENSIFCPCFGSKSWIGIWPFITTLFPCSNVDLLDFIKNSDLPSDGDSISSTDSALVVSANSGSTSNVNGKTLRFCMWLVSIIFVIVWVSSITLVIFKENTMINSSSLNNNEPT